MIHTLKSLSLNLTKRYLSPKNKEIAKYTFKRSLFFLSWIPVLYAFTEHVVYIGKIEGMSMKPTFNPPSTSPNQPKDHVILWKLGTKTSSNLNIDDVIFLRSPMNPEKIYTKRIKGKQGDLIVPRYPDTRNRVMIPVNHVWVEGDNIHSIDSNTYGPISNGLVVGKAVYIIWPLNRIGAIPNGGRECRENKLASWRNPIESV